MNEVDFPGWGYFMSSRHIYPPLGRQEKLPEQRTADQLPIFLLTYRKLNPIRRRDENHPFSDILLRF